MRFAAPIIAAILFSGCNSGPAPATEPPPPPPVKDDSAMLPLTGRTATSLVPNHLLGFPKLPGGTIGDYAIGDRRYQLFIIETGSNQEAALMLMDAKSAMGETQVIPWMGGYFGTNGTRPIYVFPKLRYLAGVAGLSKDDADPIARTLAARLK